MRRGVVKRLWLGLHEGRVLGERERHLDESVLLAVFGHDGRLHGVAPKGARPCEVDPGIPDKVREGDVLVQQLDRDRVLVDDVETELFIPHRVLPSICDTLGKRLLVGTRKHPSCMPSSMRRPYHLERAYLCVFCCGRFESPLRLQHKGLVAQRDPCLSGLCQTVGSVSAVRPQEPFND